MTYDNFKKGLFRFSILIIFILEFFAYKNSFYARRSMGLTTEDGVRIKGEVTKILWFDYNHTEPTMIAIPIIVLALYFLIIWTTKGFLGKE